MMSVVIAAGVGAAHDDGEHRVVAEPASVRDSGGVAPGLAVEAEVLANIRRQPAGLDTLEAFNLPEAYLRRVADRIIRSTFEERYRIVVRADSGAAPLAAPGGARSSPGRYVQWRLWVLGTITTLAAATCLILIWRAQRGGS